MEITIGYLKKVFSEIEKSVPNSNDIIIADLETGNNNFNPFQNAKSLLLLKGGNGWRNKIYLAHNGLGSHFTNKGEQSDLKCIAYFQENEFVFIK